MNTRGRRKPTSNPKRPKPNSKKPKPSSFFEPLPPTKRPRPDPDPDDDVIDSDDSDLEPQPAPHSDEDGSGSERDDETAAEKKYRIAKEHIERLRAITRKMEGEEGEEEEGEEEDGVKSRRVDALVADMLQREQLEHSGRARRLLASRILKPEGAVGFRVLHRHQQSVTAVALSEDDSRGFSASKDGTIFHWDVETGKKEKYMWPDKNSDNVKDKPKKQSKHVLSLAVSSDGRYLASGGMDRLVHLWDARTRKHIQAFSGHKGPVSCLTFRQGTAELFSGSFDRMIKWWNAEDRCHVNNLFGHQAEVLTIDCLRKERILSVGRDRSLRLFKVPEESSLRYSTPTSALECGCFINNEEFLSGSDDGNVELWSLLRRKPAYIVKNAHCMPDVHDQLHQELPNGVEDDNAHREVENCSSAQSWVSSVTVCRGSDLAASGAGNGLVRLWAVESDARPTIKPLHDLPLVGFVNSLAFARSGRFLLAGVGQEPRLGRWGRVAAARNGVALCPLSFSDEVHT